MFKKVSFVVSCMLVLTMVASADLVTIGSSKVDDATIDGNPLYAGRNNGASGQNVTGNATNAALTRSTLMRFDVSEIPVGSIINSATLELRFRTGGTNYDYIMIDIFKISAANAGWTEGIGTGGLPLDGEVTWTSKNHNVVGGAWAGSAGLSTSGVDYDATAIASIKSFDPAEDNTSTNYGDRFIDIAAALQDWVNNPAGNAGMVFKQQTDAANGLKRGYLVAKEFTASEYWREPTLQIDYTPVPEPMTITLLGLGGLLIRRKK